MSQTKYRPSLTATQIEHLINLCKLEQPISDTSIEILGILAPFQAKIQNGALTPAYKTTPKSSILESLGAAAPMHDKYVFQNVVYSSKEEYWKACYNVYAINPTSLTVVEIQAAKEHMYLTGLMSPEEMVEFERAAFGVDFCSN